MTFCAASGHQAHTRFGEFHVRGHGADPSPVRSGMPLFCLLFRASVVFQDPFTGPHGPCEPKIEGLYHGLTGAPYGNVDVGCTTVGT